MADIILKDENGNDATFEGVDSVSFRAVGGGTATFTSGGGGVTSWNDLTDKPFEEKIEYTDTLTWDGNFETFEGYKFTIDYTSIVHVSDSVPLISDIGDNYIIEIMDDRVGENEVAVSEFTELDNGAIMGSGGTVYVFIIPTNDFAFDDTITFAKKGVYLVRTFVNDDQDPCTIYCSKFSIPNYNFAVTTIKKIDEKFIPTKPVEPVKELLMYSSTKGSNKKFKIVVNDEGVITAIRVYEEGEVREYPVSSIFDSTGDGVLDIHLFSNELFEQFTGNDVYHINAVEDIVDDYGNDTEPYTHYMLYDEVAAGTGTLPPHVYCYDNKADNYLRYQFDVAEDGIYELAAHLRIKDEQLRGATYTINKGTEYEHAFATTYGWNTLEEALEVRNSDELQGAYMRGMFVYLHAGTNSIRITIADGVEKNQHFRDFYLLKVAELPTEIKKVTMDQAENMGINLGEGGKLPEYYDITVTFNNGAPRASDGFCRVITSNGHKMSIYSINLASGQTMPTENSTVTLRGKIGCVNSSVNGDIGKETRIFDATLL